MRCLTMRYSQNIFVVLATANPKDAVNLLNGMHKSLPSFRIQASVLLIGMAESSDLDDSHVPIEVIKYLPYYPPIVDSRNICQAHLREKLEKNAGIGFVLDDDLSWRFQESEFTEIVEQLLENNCDMAFSALSGDSPIPKEYTRTSPVLDVLLSISDEYQGLGLNDIDEYLSNISVANSKVSLSNSHHDFYTFDKNEFNRFYVDIVKIDWHEFIERLSTGRSTTRRIYQPTQLTKANGRERGGATLILNSDVLQFKNDSIRTKEFTSRRSDMIMATDAASNGFNLFNTPPMLEHLRDETFDTHDYRKLIGDILGYALVEAKDTNGFCKSLFQFHLSQRVEHTTFLLTESTKMIRLLESWLTNNEYIDRKHHLLLKNMVKENMQSLSAIQKLDLGEIEDCFDHFVTRISSC